MFTPSSTAFIVYLQKPAHFWDICWFNKELSSVLEAQRSSNIIKLRMGEILRNRVALLRACSASCRTGGTRELQFVQRLQNNTGCFPCLFKIYICIYIFIIIKNVCFLQSTVVFTVYGCFSTAVDTCVNWISLSTRCRSRLSTVPSILFLKNNNNNNIGFEIRIMWFQTLFNMCIKNKVMYESLSL